MNFLDKLKSLFTDEDSSAVVYWIYARCRRCGEAIKVRLDLKNDLSDRDEGGYIVHKTLMGNQHCFERLEVTLIFDDNRKLVDQTISRGEFITMEEYEAYQIAKAELPKEEIK